MWRGEVCWIGAAGWLHYRRPRCQIPEVATTDRIKMQIAGTSSAVRDGFQERTSFYAEVLLGKHPPPPPRASSACLTSGGWVGSVGWN